MKPSSDAEAMRLILDGLVEAGCKVTHVHDGEEPNPVGSIDEALVLLNNLDEATVWIDLPPGYDRSNSFIYFVMGNSPEEVACDYGVSLSPLLDPIIEPWWS